MPKLKSIKACRNLWGNWSIYISGVRHEEIGCNEWLTKYTLSDLLLSGKYELSDKHSDIKMKDIEDFRKSS